MVEARCIYQIYARSFQDSNGDGVGDLNGITTRLDYLKNLGIDAIWITPISSPQVDFGYDISVYTAIDPQYGTMDDFDRLVHEAKKRGIRVIMDFVANRTSDQHIRFRQSRSSRTNSKRDWYIWRDGKGVGQPPNSGMPQSLPRTDFADSGHAPDDSGLRCYWDPSAELSQDNVPRHHSHLARHSRERRCSGHPRLEF
jgi:glycosidase